MATHTNLLEPRTIAVIGAGPAGLVTAKVLKDKGFEVVVFERGSKVGGTWQEDSDNGRNYLYRNLHINTSRKLTQFSDLPFDAATQRIPDHRDMARYLDAYARRLGLDALIRFRTDVTELRPLEATGSSGSRWMVRTSGGGEEIFASVVVCTGPFSRPVHAQEICDGFLGEYWHSSGYRAPEAFVGKRVCIIGAGNSAVDIASDICTTAARTALVARSPVFIMPHFLFGRAIGDIGALMQRRWFPAALRRKLMGWLIRAVHGDMTSHGFKPLTHRVHATISSTIVQDILFERVQVKQGIAAIRGSEIEFVDGSREAFDAVIAATGFVTEFPFLSKDLVPAGDSRLQLYKRIVAPRCPGLYFVGMLNLDTPINHACERQARWIAAVEMEAIPLPAEDEMRSDIASKQAWVERTFGHAARHSLQEDSVSYYAELDRVLRRGRRRARSDGRDATPNVMAQPMATARPLHPFSSPHHQGDRP